VRVLKTKLKIDLGIATVHELALQCAFCKQLDVIMRPIMFLDFKGTTMEMCSNCVTVLFGDVESEKIMKVNM